MKLQLAAWIAGASLLCAPCALGEGATYVFPYEGFRYAQQADETVLTQTNLGEHEAILESLGTTKEAVLASYVASGIVMEVIPDEGGQIAVSVTDAGDFGDVDDAAEMSESQRAAFLAQFEESGLYESCAWVESTPACVRMTSSAMYASMPVYMLRYATLHLGRLYMFTQTVVGREPAQEDDARMEEILSGIKLLSSIPEATPTPTATPEPTPTPTPSPTPGVAEVVKQTGELTVEGVPAFTSSAQLTVTGTAEAGETVTIRAGDKRLGQTTVRKDGTFSADVKLREQGDILLEVTCGEDGVTLAVCYRMEAASLAVTEPESRTFTGEYAMVRGVTEPGATVYISGKGMNSNVKAGKDGTFNMRVFMTSAGTQTYTLRAKADGFNETSIELTLTRELTEREQLAAFREKRIELSYEDFAADVQKYVGSKFTYRGKVMTFTDYDGSPCALVCVSNPSTGVWNDPVYIILDAEAEVAEGDVLTFYLVGEGGTLPADAVYTASGQEEEAPVARAMYVTNAR